MIFDPRVAEISTNYGTIKFYTTTALETYLTHIDRSRANAFEGSRTLGSQFPRNIKQLESLVKKSKRGRPFGSRNKKKEEPPKPIQTVRHIIEKEPFETTQEFKARKKEELAEH